MEISSIIYYTILIILFIIGFIVKFNTIWIIVTIVVILSFMGFFVKNKVSKIKQATQK